MNASLLICLVLILPIGAIRFHGNEFYEGDPCEMEDGTKGECTRITNCMMRIREVQIGVRATSLKGHCSFDGFAEIVCCPKEKEQQSSTASSSTTNQTPRTIPNFIIESIATSSTGQSTEIIETSPESDATTAINHIAEETMTTNYTTTTESTSEASQNSIEEMTKTVINQSIEAAAEIIGSLMPKTTIATIPTEGTTSSSMEIRTSTVTSRTTELVETDITDITDGRISVQSTDTVINQTTEATMETSDPLMEETTVPSSTLDTMGPLIELLSSTIASRITETTASTTMTQATIISDDLNEVRPAGMACNEYKKGFLDKDGKPIFLMPILIGEPILKYEEFPFIAALGYKIKKDNSKLIQYKCGGTLITRRHILTAAHCVSNADNNVPVEVRLGSTDISNTNLQIMPVGEFIVHPKYSVDLMYHNIAIIKLSNAVVVSRQVMPICLQYISIPKLTLSINMSRIITGWGVRSEAFNDLPNMPSLRLIDEPKCMEFYENSTSLAQGADENIICLQDESIMRSTGSCQSDNSSGIPLIQVNEDSINVIGVELSSQNCGNNIPGVYVNIFNYIDWIEKVVWPDMKPSAIPMVNTEIDIRSNI